LREFAGFHGPEPLLIKPARGDQANFDVRLRLAASVLFSFAPVHDRGRIEQSGRLEDQRLDIEQALERVLRQTLRAESLRPMFAKTDALLNRDAISPVNRLTTSLANSSAIAAPFRTPPCMLCSRH
jgi:hypothetical protein